MTHKKCLVVSVSAETLPSVFTLLFSSYFAVFKVFLGINVWAEVCRPRPITAQGRDCGQCACLTKGEVTQWHTPSHRAGRQTEDGMTPVFQPNSRKIQQHRVLQRGVGVFTWILERNRSETIRKSRFISLVHFYGCANGAPSLDSPSSSL